MSAVWAASTSSLPKLTALGLDPLEPTIIAIIITPETTTAAIIPTPTSPHFVGVDLLPGLHEYEFGLDRLVVVVVWGRWRLGCAGRSYV